MEGGRKKGLERMQYFFSNKLDSYSKEIYLKHGSRKSLRKNINNKKIVSKEKEVQYELKLDF